MPTNYRATGIGRTRYDYDKQYKEELATVTKVFISLDELPENSLNAINTLYSEFENSDYVTKNANIYGAIEFRFSSDKDTLEKYLDIALPLNKDTFQLPVLDETVYIRNIDSIMYYTRANYQNSPNFDSNPSIVSKTLKISSENDSSSGNSDISEIVASNIPNNVQKNDSASNRKTEFNGTYFKRDLRTHQLSLREGDTIFQGRFGNSIRLSGYLHSNKDDGKSYPAFIIRNRESADNTAKKVYDVVDEDINNDGSSIHITSGEYISPYSPTVNYADGYNFPSEAKGDQIIVNSDRVTLSSKADSIFLYGNKNISLLANNVVTIDSTGIDITSRNTIHISATDDNDMVFSVDNGRILLGSGKVEQQMILGNKMINLIAQLLDAINQMQIATPSGPSAPGPINRAAFTDIGNKLKDCLSKTNYLV
jgi:hypothetical protein